MTSLTDVNFSFEVVDAYAAMLFVLLSVFLPTARSILGAGQWPLRCSYDTWLSADSCYTFLCGLNKTPRSEQRKVWHRHHPLGFLWAGTEAECWAAQKPEKGVCTAKNSLSNVTLDHIWHWNCTLQNRCPCRECITILQSRCNGSTFLCLAPPRSRTFHFS